jgi:hypothetical protein
MIPASDCAKMQVVEKWADGQNCVLHQNARNCTKTDTKLAPSLTIPVCATPGISLGCPCVATD